MLAALLMGAVVCTALSMAGSFITDLKIGYWLGTTPKKQEAQKFSTVDRMMNNGFEANRGRLPMPITGNYRIVSHFGQYNVEGLKGVTLDNKGINIMGGPGAQARCVYDGEVSAVIGYGGSMVVMVRHGAYISVYCNLRSVSVSRGQKVCVITSCAEHSTQQVLQVAHSVAANMAQNARKQERNN